MKFNSSEPSAASKAFCKPEQLFSLIDFSMPIFLYAAYLDQLTCGGWDELRVSSPDRPMIKTSRKIAATKYKTNLV